LPRAHRLLIQSQLVRHDQVTLSPFRIPAAGQASTSLLVISLQAGAEAAEDDICAVTAVHVSVPTTPGAISQSDKHTVTAHCNHQ